VRTEEQQGATETHGVNLVAALKCLRMFAISLSTRFRSSSLLAQFRMSPMNCVSPRIWIADMFVDSRGSLASDGRGEPLLLPCPLLPSPTLQQILEHCSVPPEDYYLYRRGLGTLDSIGLSATFPRVRILSKHRALGKAPREHSCRREVPWERMGAAGADAALLH